MRYLRLLAVLGIFLIPASYAQAQRVVVGIGVGGPAYYGPPPVCSYGYYDYYPYPCAPYGYYGPEWFSSGVFIGAGPWFHGFYGRPGYWGRRDFDDRRFSHRDFDDRWHGFDHDRGWRGRDGDHFRGDRDSHGGFHGGGNFHGGGDFHSFNGGGGNFHGGGSFHGGGNSHGGGGFHGGGGSHGGGRR